MGETLPRRIYKMRDRLWSYPERFPDSFARSSGKVLPVITICLLVFLHLFISPAESLKVINSSEQYTSYNEGVIGDLGSLNPLFVPNSDVDSSIHSLLYRKLYYLDSQGSFLPGIASEVEIDSSGKIITLFIDEDLKWSDGETLDASDVVYSIEKSAELAELGYNTLGNSYKDVEIKNIDGDRVEITLPEPSPTALELFSIFVVPQHVMSDFKDSDLISYGELGFAVSSGPYTLSSASDSLIRLRANSNYFKPPHITSFNVWIFKDSSEIVTAYKNALIDGFLVNGIQRERIGEELGVYDSDPIGLSTRKKIVFINTRDEKFEDFNVRRALSQVIDREDLVEALGTDVKPVRSPFPSSSFAFDEEFRLDEGRESAKTSMEEAGYVEVDGKWLLDRDDTSSQLTITMTYVENEVNERIVEHVEQVYTEFGVKFIREAVNNNRYVNDTIAGRNFELILSEVKVSIDPDQYNLWHSTQADYPDLNLSGYEYGRADILLEDARKTRDQGSRKELYSEFSQYWLEDVPAFTLYENSFTYYHRRGVSNIDISDISSTEDRFRDVHTWR